MKDVKKILLSVILIGSTVLIIDIIFGQVADKIFINSNRTKFLYAINSNEDIDWLILGSSRAARHYDTPYLCDSLGIKAMNLGQDGMGLTYYSSVFKAYINSHHPDTVILDLLLTDLSGILNNRMNALYPYAKLCPDIRKTAEKLDKKNKYLLSSNLLRYNPELFQLIKKIKTPYKPNSMGFEPLPPKNNNNLKKDSIINNHNIDIIAEECLLDIIELCKENNIKLYVVYSPWYTIGDKQTPISDICKANCIQIINATDFRLPIKEEEYFDDPFHLNEKGAREYTKFIIKAIRNVSVQPHVD